MEHIQNWQIALVIWLIGSTGAFVILVYVTRTGQGMGIKNNSENIKRNDDNITKLYEESDAVKEEKVEKTDCHRDMDGVQSQIKTMHEGLSGQFTRLDAKLDKVLMYRK